MKKRITTNDLSLDELKEVVELLLNHLNLTLSKIPTATYDILTLDKREDG